MGVKCPTLIGAALCAHKGMERLAAPPRANPVVSNCRRFVEVTWFAISEFLEVSIIVSLSLVIYVAAAS
jgi:hypothetical protein